MFCGKCGAKLTDGTPVCPVCGRALGPVPPRGERPGNVPVKKEKRKTKPPRKRRSPWGWILSLVILLLAAAVVGLAMLGRSTRLNQEKGAGMTLPGDVEAYTAEDWLANAPDLRLYLSTRIFIIGENRDLTLTVKCSDAVTEDVTVTDENGNQVAVLPNDGSGELKTQISYGRAEECSGYMIAKAGEYTSQPEDFSVQPKVTEEMVRALYGVSDDLVAFLTDRNFEDAYSEEAFSEIRSFLESHRNVSQVQENNGVLLYWTNDSLMGSYGMGRRTEGAFGYSTPEAAYKKWEDGTSTAEDVIQTDIVPTNSQCLILAPEYSDYIVNESSRSVYEMVKNVYDSTIEVDQCAQDIFADGSFTDYGFLVLFAHGSVINRDRPETNADDSVRYDGSKMLFFCLGKMEEDEGLAYLSGVKEGYQMVYTSYNEGHAACHATLDTSDDLLGRPMTTLYVSTRFLEISLEGKCFDNTVVYLNICHAFNDPQLKDLLIGHGASMVIGSTGPVGAYYSEMVMGELMRELAKEKEDGTYATYSECIDMGSSDKLVDRALYHWEFDPPVSKKELDATVTYFKSLSKKELDPLFPSDPDKRPMINSDEIGKDGKPKKVLDVSKYGKNVANYNEDVFRWYASSMWQYHLKKTENALIEHKAASFDQEKRVLHGNGSLSGQVRTIDGTPLAGAEVTAYQWMDHKFTQHSFLAVTDEDGMYTFKDLSYGVYVLEAWYDGRTAITSIELNQLENEADDIFLDTLGNIVLTSEIICENTDYRSDITSENICFLPQVLDAPTTEIQQAIDEIAKNMRESYHEKHQWNHDCLEVTPLSYYCNRNVLSMSTHAWDMQEIDENNYTTEDFQFLNANIDTGEKVAFPAILSGLGSYPVVKGAWQQLADAHAEMDDYWARKNGGTAVSDAMAGKLGGWAFTPQGLSLELYEEFAIRGGRYHTIVPYEKLRGELNDQYILPPKLPTGGSGSVTPLTPQQAEAESKDCTVWGTPTRLALKVDGTATNLQVYACTNLYSRIHSKGVIFFARYLNNAVIWIPDWQEGVYKITWETGGQDFAAVIENGEVISYQRVNVDGLCYPVPNEVYFNTHTPDEGDNGLDIYHDLNVNVSTDTPVYAVADGTATFYQAYTTIDGVDTLTGYGNYVELTASDKTLAARYCHLDRFENVNQTIPSSATQIRGGSDGQMKLSERKVRAGEILGYIGSTGNSNGTHLHFELRENGKRVDPVTVFPNLIK